MCSCGGLLTDWCYECGDEICPHCGCLSDHERDDDAIVQPSQRVRGAE